MLTEVILNIFVEKLISPTKTQTFGAAQGQTSTCSQDRYMLKIKEKVGSPPYLQNFIGDVATASLSIDPSGMGMHALCHLKKGIITLDLSNDVSIDNNSYA